MENGIIEHTKFEAPITFDYTLEQAKQIQEQAEKLVLEDWQDEVKYKEIRKERTKVNGINKAIYNRKRELKAEAETWLKKVEARAQALSLPLDMAAAHLTKEIQKRDDELARIKLEEEQREKIEIERRVNLAMAINWQKPMYLLQAMSLEDFERGYLAAKEIHEQNLRIEAENKRLADEMNRQQAERMAALERENQELKARQAAEAEAAKAALAAKEQEERKNRETAERMARLDSLMKEVQEQFPTLPLAWAEIVRLKRELEVF